MKIAERKNNMNNKLVEMDLLEEDVKDIRILKRNLVYIKCVPKFLAFQDLLIRPEFLGQYGNITQIFIKKEKPQKSKQDSFGVHVTYQSPAEASLAILCINGFKVNNFKLKAAFGMTKFCQFYLRDKKCPKKKCTYIHYSAKPQDITSTSNKKINRQIRSVSEINTIKYVLHNKLNFQPSCVSLPIFPHMSVGLQKMQDFQKNDSSKQHKIKLGRIFIIDDQQKNIPSFARQSPRSQSNQYYQQNKSSEFSDVNSRQNQQLINICQSLQNLSSHQQNENQLKTSQQRREHSLSDYQNQPFLKAKFADYHYGSSTEDDSVYNRRFENNKNRPDNLFFDQLLVDDHRAQDNFNTFWSYPNDESSQR